MKIISEKYGEENGGFLDEKNSLNTITSAHCIPMKHDVNIGIFADNECDSDFQGDEYPESNHDHEDDLENEKVEKHDPWGIVDSVDENSVSWSDMTCKEKTKSILLNLLKGVLAITCLYFFVCSLSLLSDSFQILAGKTAGDIFTHESFLSNPVTGLIIGILVTVLVQSSSTSTSIIITMVGAGILQLHEAIPIIMGTNIGTSVTNTIVAITQASERETFRKAFAGATVHDMFNLLSVLILLPLEVVSGYLEKTTYAIIRSMNLNSTDGSSSSGLSVITAPVVTHVIQVNKTIIQLVAQEIELEETSSMIKIWCEQTTDCIANFTGNVTNTTKGDNCEEVLVGIRKCEISDFLFANTGMSDPAVGAILLVISLIMLCGCLILMVKLLSSLMQGSVSKIIKKVINTNFPTPFGWVTGYLALLVGAVLTFLVQSSSVFTSTLTPLVGMGVISIKRMYPLTLGANIGTTATGILAALATEGSNLQYALQLAFCNLFFNITAIIIWYPVPIMRRVPIGGAKNLGNITAQYRWFAVLYLISVFFVIPLVLLALSFAGMWVMGGVLILVLVLVILVVSVNTMQDKKPSMLPEILRTWDFLPLCLRSLKPYDDVFTNYLLCCKCCKASLPEIIDQDEKLTSYDDVSINTVCSHSTSEDMNSMYEKDNSDCASNKKLSTSRTTYL